MRQFFRSDSQSPSLSLLAMEPGRAMLDYLFAHLPQRLQVHGDGHPVIVYPGLGAGAWSTSKLRHELTAAGFNAQDWGFGQNTGPRGGVAAWISELREAVASVQRTEQRKVSLVGWSLGGIYAREIARVAPTLVRQVITLGSPFAARSVDTNAAWLYRILNGSRPPVDHLKFTKQPLPVPSTSIYSRSDGVVPWRGCLQPRGTASENIEVTGVSHLGLGVNREVLKLIVDRLAQPEDGWQRFRADSLARGR
jgi:predicted alpha/beta hydrolase family esterase